MRTLLTQFKAVQGAFILKQIALNPLRRTSATRQHSHTSVCHGKHKLVRIYSNQLSTDSPSKGMHARPIFPCICMHRGNHTEFHSLESWREFGNTTQHQMPAHWISRAVGMGTSVPLRISKRAIQISQRRLPKTHIIVRWLLYYVCRSTSVSIELADSMQEFTLVFAFEICSKPTNTNCQVKLQ